MIDISKTRSEYLFHLIMENANDLIAVLDKDFKIEYINEQAHKKITGHSNEDIIEKYALQFVHLGDIERFTKTLKESWDSGAGKVELRYKHKEGHYIWLEVQGRTFLDKNGEKKGIMISRDIIERKKAEQKLKESEEKYKKAYNLINFYKDLFAHDMNNALQSIVSSVEHYNLNRDNPEKLREFGDIVEIVKTHAKRGATLISNVLKLSKLDENEKELSVIDAFGVLNNSVGHTISSYQDRNVKIKVNGISKEIKINGNELLMDVFDNILDNAVKYNNKGEEIKIEICISELQVDNINFIKFEFKDYGMGVNYERKRNLFEKVYSEDISDGGMGIGLSLVKNIIDKYGGKIWVEDRIEGDYSKGCNFVILLREA